MLSVRYTPIRRHDMLQRLATVIRNRNLNPNILQLLSQHALVHKIVLHDQHVQIGGRYLTTNDSHGRHVLAIARPIRQRRGLCAHAEIRCCSANFAAAAGEYALAGLDVEGEGAADPGFRGEADRAAVHFGEAPRDEESQARAA